MKRELLCPVTGRRVVSPDDWTNVEMSRALTSSFSIIGDAIIYSRPRGRGDSKGLRNSLALNETVAEKVGGGNGPYVQIEDYADITGSSQSARREFTRYFNTKANKRLKAVIFCNLSPLMAVAVKIGSRFTTAEKRIHVVRQYSDAIRLAADLRDRQYREDDLFVLDQPVCIDDSARSLSPVSVLSDESLDINTPTFSNKSVLIDGCILHATSKGRIAPEHIPSIEYMRSQYQATLPAGSSLQYLVTDASRLEGSNRRVRMKFMQSVKDWHRRFPFRMYILHGADRYIKAATQMARPLMPFKARTAKDLNHAFELIQNDRKGHSGDRESKPSNAPTPPPTREDIENLTAFTASINWEEKGIAGRYEVSENHPLFFLYQSIELIKEELDELFAEREQAAATLRQSEEKYRTILEKMEDGYFEVDIAGNFTFYNDAMSSILGYESDELTGKNNREYMDDENAQKVYRAFNHVYRTGESYKALDWELIRKDGTRCSVNTSVSLMKDDAGRPVGFKGIARDVTEVKRAEKEKEALHAQLRQAQKMEAIGTLAGGIAHDFNNILSAVLGYTELALKKVEPETPLHKNLSSVLHAGERAKNLVKQILALSRHDHYDTKPVSIVPLVKETLKMLRSTIPTSIEFRQSFCSEPLIVQIDPTQIHQVIMNLATNAAHAMSGDVGTLAVDVEAIRFDENMNQKYLDLPPGDYVRLSVSDTGEGIARQNLDKIFEPYFTTKEKGTGTGLGLSVVHGIVKSHGGHITVYSEPGQGTTFHVYLPVVTEKWSAEQPACAPESLPTGTESILLVDDEKSIAEMQQQSLGELGYTVTAASRSEDALAALRASPEDFDIVITDMTMPKMPGDILATEIKAIRPDIPVILNTGFSAKLKGDINNAAIDAFLMKPVDTARMAKTVRRLLDGSRNSAAN